MQITTAILNQPGQLAHVEVFATRPTWYDIHKALREHYQEQKRGCPWGHPNRHPTECALDSVDRLANGTLNDYLSALTAAEEESIINLPYNITLQLRLINVRR